MRRRAHSSFGEINKKHKLKIFIFKSAFIIFYLLSIIYYLLFKPYGQIST